MKICDPIQNRFIEPTTCYWMAVPAIIGVVATVVGTGVSMIAAQQQAAQASAIANYNAQVQAQNAQIAYSMQLYQIQQNQAIAQAQLAQNLMQQQVAQAQYQAQLNNAETLRQYAEQSTKQGQQQQLRMREENAQRLATIRAKYAGSGVATEGSPLAVLADSARLAETAVLDTEYQTELERAKQLRAADIEEWKANFSLIDKAQLGIEGARINYDLSLAPYDAAIARARYQIGLDQANITRAQGAADAAGFRNEGIASLIGGIGSAAQASSGAFNYLADYQARQQAAKAGYAGVY